MIGDHEPKVLTEEGYLFTLEEWEERYPDSAILPEFRKKVAEYRAHAEEIEAKYEEESRRSKFFKAWENSSIQDISNYAKELVDKIYKLMMLFEMLEERTNFENAEKHFVEGNNSLTKCITEPKEATTRERILLFVYSAETFLKSVK